VGRGSTRQKRPAIRLISSPRMTCQPANSTLWPLHVTSTVKCHWSTRWCGDDGVFGPRKRRAGVRQGVGAAMDAGMTDGTSQVLIVAQELVEVSRLKDDDMTSATPASLGSAQPGTASSH
jgi:hypothetical protein